MTVDKRWATRNLAFDGAELAPGGAPPAVVDRALQRELIDFGSYGAEFADFAAAAPPASTPLSDFVEIQWPAGFSPQPGPAPTGESLPAGDVLVVTWTVDEGHALSRVLTPGFDSKEASGPYTKNFSAIAEHMRPECPAVQLKRLGTYWTTQIGDKQATLFKSDSHMSQDGPDLPNATVWRQIIEDCKPGWVITTGTGGGIGPEAEVGDVVVSRFVTFDCRKEFASLNGESFASQQIAPMARFQQAEGLFKYNAQFLPQDNTREPRVVDATSQPAGVLTTDFFGFDNTEDTYELQGKGDLSEMGDAVLGMVCSQIGTSAPQYASVRNVSDPQIDSAGLTLAEQAKLAAEIYKGYGRWSTVCSSIVCWAMVAGM